MSMPLDIEKTRIPPEEATFMRDPILLGVLKKMQNPYHASS